MKESMVFHAGTKTENNRTEKKGGRVRAVSSFGKDFKEAVKVSCASISKISFEGMYCMKDIGFDLG